MNAIDRARIRNKDGKFYFIIAAKMIHDGHPYRYFRDFSFAGKRKITAYYGGATGGGPDNDEASHAQRMRKTQNDANRIPFVLRPYRRRRHLHSSLLFLDFTVLHACSNE